MKKAKYQIGVVTASTKPELGLNAIKHIGLAVDSPELQKNVGKKIKFNDESDKHKYPYYKGVFTIVGVQKMWGHDEEGKYVPNIIGYRVIKNKNDFGCCALPKEINFVK